jgi:iron complex transport system ATP-binding protein
MTADPILETRGLAIGYRHHSRPVCVVAEGIDVALSAGQFVCLLGPNGAGKSTLIRTLAGMQTPIEGTIFIAGKPLRGLSARALAQRMSLVLTQRIAVGMMPVLSFVALGRHPYTNWMGRLSREDEAAVSRSLADVGIEALVRRPVCELSDGERQKVKIARALAQEPQVMILDEATAFLDLPRRVELMSLLKRLAHESGRAILLSTHDLDLALRSADRLWLLPPRGPLREGVPEDLVLDDAFSATFSDGAIAFDKGSGAFVATGRKKGAVSLQGDGTPAMWTYRALERAGYRVLPEGAVGVSVQVVLENDRPVWIVGDAEECCCASIEEMLGALNERLHKEQEEDFRG